MVSVQQRNADYPCDMTKQVIINVTNAGNRLISVFSDSNVVNYKSFMKFTDSDQLLPFIENLVNAHKPEEYYFEFTLYHTLPPPPTNVWFNRKELCLQKPDTSEREALQGHVISELVQLV